MKDRKKYIEVFIIGMVIVLLVGIVSLVSAVEVPTKVGDSWFDRIYSSIQHYFHQQEMFTIYGRELSCSITPDTTINLVKGEEYNFKEETVCGNKDFFVNYFRGERGFDQYLKEIYYYQEDNGAYITDGDGQGSIYLMPYVICDAGMYWDEKCYVQIYCCTDGVCTRDSDCRSDEECNKATASISDIFPQFGVCEQEEVTYHKTDVYRCSNGQKTSLDDALKGDINWCPDKDDINYILPSGGTSGVCYEEEDEPMECHTPQKTCWRIQDDKCDSISIFTTSCENLGYYSSKSICESKLENGDEDGVVNGNGVTPEASTITWSEFYSISDDEFYEKNYYCTSDSNCPLKENYEVSCIGIGEESVSKLTDRDMKVIKVRCDKGLGFLDELLNTVKSIFPGFALLPNLCDGISEGWVGFKRALAGEGNYAGYCVAESTTWYGKLWDNTLKTVGGMGLPAQYVLLITVMILITLIGLGVRMFK